MMTITGKTHVFGDNVNTDEIIPARYLSSSDPGELARHVMEDIRPGFGARCDPAGAILVAGRNFGCGSSREHAPLAIKAAGISAVVAISFARIFFRNAVNIGLPIIELAEAGEIPEGQEIEIDLEGGSLRCNARSFSFRPYPDFLQRIVACGGWLEYAKRELLKNTVDELKG